MTAAISDTKAQVTDDQLARYASLIYDKTGIRISPQKKTLLSNRLRRRLRATGLDCFDDYLGKLKQLHANDPEWNAFLQEITTHETYLFRDMAQWDWLRETYLADAQAAARRGEHKTSLSIWSAACSTGDEAYTIASCIADRLSNHSSWKINILGTDIGIGAVEAARAANFGERAMRHVPAEYKRRFFTASQDKTTWAPKPLLSAWMNFEQHNLLSPMRKGPFDLIVLKNVLIYFDAASKGPVAEHICRALKPGGYLVTGPAEGVADMLGGLERIQGWLHRKPAK